MKSYLDISAAKKGVSVGQIHTSPHAISIYQETLEIIANLFDEPDNNPAEAFTAKFLNDVIRKDLARIINGLRKYSGTDPPRDDINTAKKFLNRARDQVSVVAKHMKKPAKNIQEEYERVEMLSRCRENLEKALDYLAVFLLFLGGLDYFCFN